MKARIVTIGIVDNTDRVHYVEFKTGVNIITGKSSTGKSAILEIFDYCMGSSENNIPNGEITKYGTWFFTVLLINAKYLVIARNIVDDKRYINEESEAPNIKNINNNYFREEYQINNKTRFNPELGKYFGLTISDIEEDLETKEYRKNNAKKGRPTIRNIMPFLLQHQNLIANKHAIFYRFDENKKREETIEQFKIFVGFVEEGYFTLKQQEAKLIRKKKHIEKAIENNEKEEGKRIYKIQNILDTYFAITNKPLFNDEKATAEYIYHNYKRYINYLSDRSFEFSSDASYEKNSTLSKFENLKNNKAELEVQKLDLLHQLTEIKRTVEYAEHEYLPLASQANDEFSTDVSYTSSCPFCETSNHENYEIANRLHEALNWLNSELANTNYHLDSFKKIQDDLENNLELVNAQLKLINKEINKILDIEKRLKRKIYLDEQASRYVGRLEEFLEGLEVLENITTYELDEITRKISNLQERLKTEFNVENKISKAERYINKQIKEIGRSFDFEKAYNPINLKFSLSNFDLYHKKINDDKVYLRSMGSGANWLYSHLSLFLALHRYFCSLGDQSLIPPILFIDQPTQVYFPANIEDDSDKFNPEELAKREGKTKNLDDDMKAVTNIFDQLVNFCDETAKKTGITPQIIVTDHADNLKLENANFDDLVVARWRKRGFIHPLPNSNKKTMQDNIDNQIGEQLTLLPDADDT